MMIKAFCYIDGLKNKKEGLLKITKSGISFEFTDEYTSYGTWFKKGDIIKCKFNNQCKHNLKDWQDGTYTIYPFRGGVPYYITTIENEM